MKEKIIFGCSALARRLFHDRKNGGHIATVFVVDDSYCDKDQFCSIPLVSYSKMGKIPADRV